MEKVEHLPNRLINRIKSKICLITLTHNRPSVKSLSHLRTFDDAKGKMVSPVPEPARKSLNSDSIYRDECGSYANSRIRAELAGRCDYDDAETFHICHEGADREQAQGRLRDLQRGLLPRYNMEPRKFSVHAATLGFKVSSITACEGLTPPRMPGDMETRAYI